MNYIYEITRLSDGVSQIVGSSEAQAVKWHTDGTKYVEFVCAPWLSGIQLDGSRTAKHACVIIGVAARNLPIGVR